MPATYAIVLVLSVWVIINTISVLTLTLGGILIAVTLLPAFGFLALTSLLALIYWVQNEL